jgi:undecaprenyl-diphosphatase
MNIWQSVVLGIVEGLTEFLPISSTFHLIVTSRLLGLGSSEFVKLFEVFIQSGAIFALVFIYAKTLLTDRQLLSRVLYAFVPTAVVGALLYKVIKSIFFESNWLMLSVFIGFGLIFLLLEKYLSQQKIVLAKTCSSISPKHALLIGLAQACSVVPGVSRAGSVIVAMVLMGYKRDEAAKFTLLCRCPLFLPRRSLTFTRIERSSLVWVVVQPS